MKTKWTGLLQDGLRTVKSSRDASNAERAACIARYRERHLAMPDLTEQLEALRVATNNGELPLACWCAPKQCHADVLAELLAAAPNLRGRVDGVGIHPYAPEPLRVLSTVGRARATLVAVGLGSVPLYVTEFGWPTQPPHSEDWAPQRLRPAYIRGTIATLGHVNCDVAMTVLYTWVTPERNPANREDWFGIQSPAGTDTADARALTTGLRAATADRPEVDLCAP